jgi:hypothetical protein
MTKDIIVSRQCMVGPDGYFGFGGDAVDGAVVVRVDFFRPEPDLDELPACYWCEYEIVYDGQVIHAWKMMGMDSVESLLSAMVDACHHFDGQYFNKIDADKRYRDVIPYMPAIPPEWLHHMRFAGTWPDWTAEQPAIFLHADGRRVTGRIALGYPLPAAGPYRASCRTLLDGIDEGRGERIEADMQLQALQLAMASLATRLRAFLAEGGRVLNPDGEGEADLEALLGPLMAP